MNRVYPISRCRGTREPPSLMWLKDRHNLYYRNPLFKVIYPLFPVPSHADGRRTRRRIFEELAKRDSSVEIMSERKEYAYGRIGSDYAETVSYTHLDVYKRQVMSNDTEAAQYQDELVVAVGEADELYPCLLYTSA